MNSAVPKSQEAQLLAHAGWATGLWRSVLLGDVAPEDARERCEAMAAGLPRSLAEAASGITETIRTGLAAVAEGTMSPDAFERLVLTDVRKARSWK